MEERERASANKNTHKAHEMKPVASFVVDNHDESKEWARQENVYA